MANVQKEWKTLSHEIEMPQGASAKYEDKILTIAGPKGEISKLLKFPKIQINILENKIEIKTERLTQREKKIIHTYRAHVNNMIKGVTEGFTYKLSVVYAKFPMTVEVKGQEFIVKNLLGEKVPRTATIPTDVSVKVEGNKDITVTGIDKEKTGQLAATLEQTTRYTHFDRRVIQDGIFIVEKPHKRYI